MVDAGLSGKKIEYLLNRIGQDIREIDAIFISHEHIDHIRGAGVLSRRHGIPLYANRATFGAAATAFKNIPQECVKHFKTGESFQFRDLVVTPFIVPHDAREPVGFRVEYDKRCIGISTDLGCMTNFVRTQLKGADLLILESNHDIEMLENGPYPAHLIRRIKSPQGHLSNDDTGKALTDLIDENTTHVLLAHLSEHNNTPGKAYSTVQEILKGDGIKHVDLRLTHPDRTCGIIEI